MSELVVAASVVKNDELALRLEELNVQDQGAGDAASAIHTCY